jgi:hypothetical protein
MDRHNEAKRRIFLQNFVPIVVDQAWKGFNTLGKKGGGGEERGEFITETHEKDSFTQCTHLGYCIDYQVTPREKFCVFYL